MKVSRTVYNYNQCTNMQIGLRIWDSNCLASKCKCSGVNVVSKR